MGNPNLPRQPLVYADGYSYTEVFEAYNGAGAPGPNPLLRVFHALFAPDRDDEREDCGPRPNGSQAIPHEQE